MANRFEGRIKRLEALQGEEVDEITDELDGYQSEALLLHLIALVSGEDGPSDEQLRQTPLQPRSRYEWVLASIPEGTAERLFAACMERMTRKAAA
jgi:hypothetical protein